MTIIASPACDRAALKRIAARAAVAEVADGMTIGLGTGSTASFAIEALGERVACGMHITTVASSLRTAAAAAKAGLTVVQFDALDQVDIGIDGADELDVGLRAIKGGGGALLREKIVAAAALRMIAVVDDSKLVARLGAHLLPVEVLPFAVGFVTRRITDLGLSATLRLAGASPFHTDQANAVLDCGVDACDDFDRLAAEFSAIPGLLGHGLFLDEFDIAYVGSAEGVRCLTRGGQT
ncbi:MAG: ribose-5-phosphate isomerase RpiA [Croceibacterium sp.]